MLQQKYQWRITYEDPSIENPAELKDITHAQYKRTHPNTNDRTIVPVASPFTFTWDESLAASDPGAVLDQIVTEHNNSTNPGRFRVYRQGGMFNVIPSSVRAKDGTLVPVQSVLDVQISFPTEERGFLDTISLILQLAGEQGHHNLILGMASPHMARERVTVGADHISARDALLVAITSRDVLAAPWRLSWILLRDPNGGDYYLSLVGVVPNGSQPQSSSASLPKVPSASNPSASGFLLGKKPNPQRE